MDLKRKLKEAEANRQANLDQVNAIAEEIEVLKQKRQSLLQETLRFDGEVRALTSLAGEEREVETK